MDNLVFSPKVYVVGRQTVVADELDQFLNDEDVSTWTTDTEIAGEKLVEVAGRNCYQSYAKPRPGGNKAYIDHILSVGHGSVLEAAVWNILVTGVSRSLTHELIRHRHFSPAQLSQRYVDESDTEFVVPPIYQKAVRLAMECRKWHGMTQHPYRNPEFAHLTTGDLNRLRELGETWINFVQHSRDVYAKLTDLTDKYVLDNALSGTERRKKAREAARSVLPNATETKIFLTFNARALRNFFELRASRHAEAEIRFMANAVYDKMVEESENLFGDYTKGYLGDGSFELTTENRKV